MKTTQNLPSRLKELRKKNKCSQEYVAEQLNISRQAISHWENGKAYPDIDNLILLADLFHISVDELLDEKLWCECKPKVEVPEEVEIPEELEVPVEEEVPGEAEVPAEVELPNEENVPAKVEEHSSLLEILVLSIILVLSSSIMIIGIIVPIFILIRSSYTKRHYKSIYILCALCIIIGVCETLAYCTYLYEIYGNGFYMLK